MEVIKLNIERDFDKFLDLSAGVYVLLTGYLISARDQAHKRLVEDIKNNRNINFEIKNSFIYYMGPTPSKENQVIGSAGPTTSSRMDRFAPFLYDMGVRATIGKGKRSIEVVEAIKKNNGLYLITIGGAGAFLSKKIKESKVIMYEDLGPEAIRLLYVEDFPVIVAIDSKGDSIW